jgi:hypothetical protein
MWDFIADNTSQITTLISVGVAFFGLIKWLDARNKALRNERYENYLRLIKIISGSRENPHTQIGITEQMACLWLLLEYKEYYEITLKILDNDVLEELSNDAWRKAVLPQIKDLVQEIRSTQLT